MRLRVGRRGWLWRWCWIWQPFLGHERRPSTIPTHLTQQSFSTGMSQWAPLEYQLPWALSVPYYTKTTSIMLQVVTTALGVVRHKRFHRQRRISTLNLQSFSFNSLPLSRNLLTRRILSQQLHRRFFELQRSKNHRVINFTVWYFHFRYTHLLS